MSATLPCREGRCDVPFAGESEAIAELFRVNHEKIVHGATFSRADPEAPFVRSSVTSLSAAQQIAQAAGELRTRVHAYIKARQGATDEEVATGLRMNPSTARPRRIELAREDALERYGIAVRDSGTKRANVSGVKATVWEAV
jgi:hypothetical protein